MKILEANAGALTNFEVLEFLRSRGAGKDSSRSIAPVAPSEFKVYDYLEQSAACNQTREIIDKFIGKARKYNLAKAEILNIINIRPSTDVEIFQIIEECEDRFKGQLEELVETVVEFLPPPPTQDAGIDDDKEAGKDEQLEEETKE